MCSRLQQPTQRTGQDQLLVSRIAYEIQSSLTQSDEDGEQRTELTYEFHLAGRKLGEPIINLVTKRMML